MQSLKESVYRANVELVNSGLVIMTWGNVSGVDRDEGVMVIKPSGVPYEQLEPDKMVIVSLETGEIIQSAMRYGGLMPSMDTPTHLELYRAFDCGAVVHTHSEYATTFAQSRKPIRAMGTTHADYFNGDIPITRPLKQSEIEEDFEKYTGLVIVETFNGKTEEKDPMEIKAVLVSYHGPFVWGNTPDEAVENAIVLEYVAKMDYQTTLLNPDAARPGNYLIEKHYRRKHGKDSYYGQKGPQSEK